MNVNCHLKLLVDSGSALNHFLAIVFFSWLYFLMYFDVDADEFFMYFCDVSVLCTLLTTEKYHWLFAVLLYDQPTTASMYNKVINIVQM